MAFIRDLIWRPLDEAPEGVYVLLRGPSGYRTTPHRYLVGIKVPKWHPTQPWRDHAGDSVTDGGVMPTEFTYLG